ncbi:MAG: DUF2894 domain-containing protein [Gammaproteobacteria bacterium]|nr:DUF2894 domain-containing protein [Gammaproteobacteria bacterium]
MRSKLDNDSVPGIDALADIDVDAPERLPAALRAFVDSGIGQYDPVRACFIQALAERAGKQRPAVADMLARKALRAMKGYHDDFVAAREQAGGVLERIAAEDPGREVELEQAFARGEFKRVLRHAGSRPVHGYRTGQLSALRDAVPRSDPDDEPAQDGSLAAALRQQDRELLQPARRGYRPAAASAEDTVELGAMRRLRQSLQAHQAQQRVTRELQVGEEDRGPLNAQALVARHLAMMHEISPAFARRFVAHMDTVLWLQRAAESVGGKKKPARKRRR